MQLTRQDFGRHLVPVAIGVVVALLVAAIVWALESAGRAQQERADQSYALDQLARIRAQLESEINTTIFLTYGLSAYVATNPALDDRKIDQLAEDLLVRARHVRHFALAPDNVITHIYPIAGNEAALGLDLMGVPAQSNAVQQAMESGHLIVTGPVDLVQGGRTLATRDPVFVRENGESRYWGLVTSVIRLESLIESAGLTDDRIPMDIALRDGGSGIPIHGPEDIFDAPTPRLSVQLPGATWEIAGQLRESFAAANQTPWAHFGYIVAALAGGMSWRMSGQAIRLHRSERRYRRFMESLPDGVCITQNGLFCYINPRLSDLSGYQPGELLGRPITDVVHDDDRQAMTEARRRRMEGEAHATENDVRLFRADGSLLHVRLNTRIIDWEGRPAALTTVTDITERQLLQAALTENRDRLAAMMQALPDVAFLLDREGRYLDVFGGKGEDPIGSRQLIGHSLEEQLPATLTQRCLDTIARALETRQMQTLTYTLSGPEPGDERWIEARVVALGNRDSAQNTVLWLAFDITTHKRTEISLRESEESFQALVENSPDVICRMDRNLRHLYASPAIERYLGVAPEKVIGRTPVECGLPDELASHWQYHFGRVFAGEGAQSLEFRVIDPQGKLLFFESRAVPEHGPEGEVDTILVISREITERKHVENQLKLAASVFHSTAEAMLVADAHRRVVRCNPAFTRLTGHTPESVVGRPAGFIRPLSVDGGVPEDCWDLVDGRGHWEGEVVATREDGDQFPAWLTLNAIHDRDNAVSHYLLALEDISHRKRMEEQLRHEATHDPLTGLPNRTLLTDRLTVALAQAKRASSPLAVLFIDLDDFKPINDSLGHRAGDHVLRIVAQRMRDAIRETDTIARLGGDEFVIVLTPPTPLAVIENIARDVMSQVSQPIVMHGQTFEVGASMGIARYPEDGDTADQLIGMADGAMYEAKASGRAQFRFCSNPGTMSRA